MRKKTTSTMRCPHCGASLAGTAKWNNRSGKPSTKRLMALSALAIAFVTLVVALTLLKRHDPLTLVTESDPKLGYLQHVSTSKNGLTYLFSNERDRAEIGFLDGETNVDQRIAVDLPIRVDPKSRPRELDRRIYFTAFPHQSLDGQSRRGLYSTGLDDGKSKLIKLGVSAKLLTSVQGRILFFTDDGSVQPWAHDLWQSDGTEAGTSLLMPVEATEKGKRGFSEFYAEGEVLLLERRESDDTGDKIGHVRNVQIWKTDGTLAGTTVAFSGDVNINSSDVRFAVMGNDRIFFSAETEESGQEPWVAPISSSEPFMLRDIHPGKQSSRAGAFMVSDDTA